ncbi:MAG: UDP-N-acetylmuramate dehydrogenase [Candidatus Puniceispirillaceae bacterium]
MIDTTALRGLILTDEVLETRTWLGVGGKADLYFEPADEADLAAFLKAIPKDMPVTILGAGSNMLIRDGGIEGAVIRLCGAFSQLSCEQDHIIAGAGATDADLARFAARHNMAGLSFLVSIPGTIGGGLRMNAGCYGSEFKDVVISARMMDKQGTIHQMTPLEMGMAYRHTNVDEQMIFLSATFRTTKGESAQIKAEMREMLQMRARTQPQGVRTGGSTFANPEGHKAWQVIDEAGCRGLRIGDASMNDKHCNFLINHGHATARDIEALGETVRARVLDKSGIHLRWEIRRLGRALPQKQTQDEKIPDDKMLDSADKEARHV